MYLWVFIFRIYSNWGTQCQGQIWRRFFFSKNETANNPSIHHYIPHIKRICRFWAKIFTQDINNMWQNITVPSIFSFKTRNVFTQKSAPIVINTVLVSSQFVTVKARIRIRQSLSGHLCMGMLNCLCGCMWWVPAGAGVTSNIMLSHVTLVRDGLGSCLFLQTAVTLWHHE